MKNNSSPSSYRHLLGRLFRTELEFEEQAFVRQLMRAGVLRIDADRRVVLVQVTPT